MKQTIIAAAFLFMIGPACNRLQDRRLPKGSAQQLDATTTPPAESTYARLPAARVVVEQTVAVPHGFVTWVYGHILDDKSTPIKLTLGCTLASRNNGCAELKSGDVYRIKFLSDENEAAYSRESYTLGSVMASGSAGKDLVFYIVEEAAVHSAAAREREDRALADRSK